MEVLLDTLVTEVGPILVQLVITALGVIGVWLGAKASQAVGKINNSKELENIRENLRANQEIAMITVEYVEQVGKTLVNDEKLDLAKQKFLEIANNRGINISDDELEVLIEQSYHSFKYGYENPDLVLQEQVVAEEEPGLIEEENK